MLTTFKTFGRAAAVALALGAATVTAMPAQAQQAPAFNFQLDLGNGNSMQFGAGPQGQGRFAPGGKPDRFCLTDGQIRRGLRGYGFDDVRVRRDLGRNRVEATARYGRWVYSMRVNRCTGYVDRVERQRPNFGGGFGLQFDFGN